MMYQKGQVTSVVFLPKCITFIFKIYLLLEKKERPCEQGEGQRKREREDP